MKVIRNFYLNFKLPIKKEIFQQRSISGFLNNKYVVKDSGLENKLSLKHNQFNIRNFCSTSPEIATYDQIKNLSIKKNGTVLIDVREPDELKETGQIPGSVNIPLKDVANALSPNTTAEKFKTLYGINKPTEDTPLIFHCRIGQRSQTAADSAKQLGFQNVRNYKGSWIEWAEKEGLK